MPNYCAILSSDPARTGAAVAGFVSRKTFCGFPKPTELHNYRIRPAPHSARPRASLRRSPPISTQTKPKICQTQKGGRANCRQRNPAREQGNVPALRQE